jgi:anti-anti-sigma factor
MKITILERDGEQVAQLEGRLDTSASTQAEQDMQPLYETTSRVIVLDCTQLQYISSSGLRLFLGLLKASKPKGIRVVITGLNESLRQVFAMTGFTSLFEFR